MYKRMIERRILSVALGVLLLFAISGCAAPAENLQEGHGSTDIRNEEQSGSIPADLFDFGK